THSGRSRLKRRTAPENKGERGGARNRSAGSSLVVAGWDKRSNDAALLAAVLVRDLGAVERRDAVHGRLLEAAHRLAPFLAADGLAGNVNRAVLLRARDDVKRGLELHRILRVDEVVELEVLLRQADLA